MKGLVRAIIVSATLLAFGQTGLAHHQPSDEQEIIALGRKFANEVLINGFAVVVRREANNAVIEKEKAEVEPLQLDSIDVAIEGGKATMTSRVVYKGRLPNGEQYERYNKLAVNFIKKDGQWKAVGGRLGDPNRRH